MKNKNLVMVSALLIGGLLTLNNSVFADINNSTTSASVKQVPIQAGKMIPMKAGNLEKETCTEIHRGGTHVKGWNIQLDALATAGTITQTTADKIQTYIDEQNAIRTTEMEKVKAMTVDERKAYFESKKANVAEKKDMLSILVEKGIITQVEADAIKAAEQTKQAEQKVIQQATKQEHMTSALNKLVESKVITSAQLIKINEFITVNQETRATEIEKIKAMTQEERVAYLKTNAGNKSTMLTQLVTDKVLTQTQADAVEKVLHSRGSQKGFGRGIDKK